MNESNVSDMITTVLHELSLIKKTLDELRLKLDEVLRQTGQKRLPKTDHESYNTLIRTAAGVSSSKGVRGISSLQ